MRSRKGPERFGAVSLFRGAELGYGELVWGSVCVRACVCVCVCARARVCVCVRVGPSVRAQQVMKFYCGP